MTTLLYLADTYQYRASATVLRGEQTTHGTALVLDQTLFYPQGGGQPADHGTITGSAGEFAVHDVRLTPEGEVYHYGTFTRGMLAAGDAVTLLVEAPRRQLNARLHSAGHLIDLAVRLSGITGLTPTKGYHFAEGPYVEYDGMLEDPSSWQRILAAQAQALVAADIPLVVEELSPSQAAERGMMAPPGKSARVVFFAGYAADGCGCGGTHVARSGEIGQIEIRAVQHKKGTTRVKYQLL
ncbi:hypothetical protein H6771_01105 [Candidatus Peribacteria bacterium]|nr:hypothetical protein [Candidatus Peribacteria bacterium]